MSELQSYLKIIQPKHHVCLFYDSLDRKHKVVYEFLAEGINNGKGIAGVNEAKILGIKVLNNLGMGNIFSISRGITWAANNGAWIISMSFGSYQSSSLINSACNYAYYTKFHVTKSPNGHTILQYTYDDLEKGEFWKRSGLKSIDVIEAKRIKIYNISIKDIPNPNDWRELTQKEINHILKFNRGSN